MSMECDTRLSMMSLRQPRRTPAKRRRTARVRRHGAVNASGMAAFALTLFTRGI